MEERDLAISEERGAKANIQDLVVYGNTDSFALLCKASSQAQGFMKSTKVCNVEDGCIVQVTTQQKNPDGSYAVAEALTYVPRVHIDLAAEPRKLMPIDYPKLGLENYLTPVDEAERKRSEDEYRYKEYLGILLQLHQSGHDCHSEINTTLAKVQELMFK
ncbi:hypothetical protein [Cohnella nanjingensis]|uniref:hypothetical protein n=1 Tax=Cohnella nanjingensis TaxID=1387779 RepID=UPI001FE97E55|nr:hypothetical protein [Cohnella nanjingensis]